MSEQIDYATPPRPLPPKHGELYITLLLFNIAGIIGGIGLLVLAAAFTVQDRDIGIAAFELWVFYCVAELTLAIITMCLKRELRVYVVIGLALILVDGVRLWLECAYHR